MAAAAVQPITAALPALAIDDEAQLIALGAELDAATTAWLQAYKRHNDADDAMPEPPTKAEKARVDALQETAKALSRREWAIGQRIIGIPASTAAGIAVKARWQVKLGEGPLSLSILADLERMAEGVS
jgi:hypothetical protein